MRDTTGRLGESSGKDDIADIASDLYRSGKLGDIVAVTREFKAFLHSRDDIQWVSRVIREIAADLAQNKREAAYRVADQLQTMSETTKGRTRHSIRSRDEVINEGMVKREAERMADAIYDRVLANMKKLMRKGKGPEDAFILAMDDENVDVADSRNEVVVAMVRSALVDDLGYDF